MTKVYECKCGTLISSPEEITKCLACGKKVKEIKDE